MITWKSYYITFHLLSGKFFTPFGIFLQFHGQAIIRNFLVGRRFFYFPYHYSSAPSLFCTIWRMSSIAVETFQVWQKPLAYRTYNKKGGFHRGKVPKCLSEFDSQTVFVKSWCIYWQKYWSYLPKTPFAVISDHEMV